MKPALASRDAVGKLCEVVPVVAPERYGVFTDDRPEAAVTRGHGAIGGGRFRRPAGMRMVITEHFRPALARGAVGIDQRLGLDLEVASRRRVDVAGGDRPVDAAIAAEQEAARFPRQGPRGLGHDPLHGRSCQFDLHPHFLSMGGGQIITGKLAGGQRLDKALAEASGLSRERIKALIGEGAVSVGGRKATQAAARAFDGADFAIEVPPATEAAARPQAMPLNVVFEDAHLIVIDKPAGLVVHPAAGNPDGTLVNALLHHCAGQLSGIGGVARPGIVHRIDKDTSGLLVVAKSDAAHEGLAKQFADHSIERVYLAVVNGHPSPREGKISERIGRSDANRKKMAVLAKDSSRGKHAVTHYKVVRIMTDCALVECRLETGRTHQVRVHLASIGHALLGDPVYGRAKPGLRTILKTLDFHRQALHAAVLGFVHPVTGDRLRFESDLPQDMEELIDRTAHSNR